jgi:hypothetical protein
MNKHLLSYYLGIFIIFASHIYMIFLIDKMDRKEIIIHSIANLVAVCMIAYYFVNKEGIFTNKEGVTKKE